MLADRGVQPSDGLGAYRKLARSLARSLAPALPHWLDYQDLEQVALIAAWQAPQSYDPTRGASLATWVSTCMRYAILQELRAQGAGTRREPRAREELTEDHDLVADESLDDHVALQQMRAALRSLPPGQANLLLVHAADENMVGTATVAGTTRARMSRKVRDATQRLRAVLRP